MGEPKWRPRRPTADLEKWLETLESRLQDAKRIKREERTEAPRLTPTQRQSYTNSKRLRVKIPEIETN